MFPERIERALREGPPDEPVYVPGAFRHARAGRSLSPFAATAVVLALVVGVVIGGGLAVLRGWNIGGPRIVTTADLLGTWRSDEITAQAWTDGISAAGFDAASIDAFLVHDPIQDSVRYTLEFTASESTGDELSISAEYDGQPIAVMSGGSFTVQADGTLHYTEIVAGNAGPRCEVFAAVTMDDGRMSLEITRMRNCDTEEQLAHTAFFELSPYTRQGP